MPHRFEDAEAWSKRFDSPERDAWQKPDDVVRALALPPDAAVVDLGAGTGYFAARLARALPGGRVLGLDVEPNMVRFMTERAKREGLTNLVARETPKDRAGLEGPVDLVLLVDTYHHLSDRPAYFRALRSSLTPRGRLAIVDFRLESERGPPKEHRLAPERVIAELAEAGFALSGRHEFLPDQYFLVFSAR
jgi:cyclopropane fatty-acyl-phospholipid synthase-like methyltransferase